MSDWLTNNTFHYSQFWDLKTLAKAKQDKGLKISLCLPTLNEEKTIGKEVVVLKGELMTRYPVLDEIAIIDSGSTDNTRQVASAFGADTYFAGDILPEMGHRGGKGENLWKAIYQLKGDIIVYVDADIKNIHPRFVYGLVAPLVYYDQMKYVKAFYDRPLAMSHGIRPSGGGRVTEILIRPLFSLFMPELTSIIQPLSGEYAARREVLEQIPFPIGYGVETAHLVDIYRKWGMEAFGQTDLDRRHHRNQDTRALARMSFGILQTFLKRLREEGMPLHGVDLDNLGKVLRQFQCFDKRYEMAEYQIVEEERPPMITIDAYRQKFGRG